MNAKEQFIFLEPPENYAPRLHVAACFCQHGEEFLFLLRQLDKTHPNTWGIPAGKLDPGDTPLGACVRELAEETAIELTHEDIEELQTVYVRYPEIDFTYTMFRTVLDTRPSDIRINPIEHQEARWLTLPEALKLPLIPGEDECIYLAYGVKLDG